MPNPNANPFPEDVSHDASQAVSGAAFGADSDPLADGEHEGEHHVPQRNGARPAGVHSSGAQPAVLSLRDEDEDDADFPAPAGVNSGSGAGFEQLSASHAEVADEASMREFYSQLVTLLTQENAAPTKKKSRNNLLSTLRRRWFPALLVSALAFLGLSSLLRPRQSTYQSSVTLLLPPRATANGPQDPFTPPEESYDTEAELAIIGSEEVVKEAMSHVPDELKVRGWGSKTAEVVPVEATSYGSPSLININVSSLDGRASLRLSNEMVRTYTERTRNRYERSRTENLKITRQRTIVAGKRLERARAELRRFKEQRGVNDVSSEQGSSSLSISGLEDAVAKASTETAAGSDAESIISDTSLGVLRQRVIEAQTRYDDILRGFLPSSPRARDAAEVLRRAKVAVAARTGEIKSANGRRLAQAVANLRTARSRASTLPGIEQNLNRLNDNVQLLQAAYRSANDRSNQLNLAQGTVAPSAKILHSPSLSSSQQKQWAQALAASLIASLGLGVLGAWLFNRFDRTVRTVSDPDEFFEVPLLGVMPATGGASGLQLSGMSTRRGRSNLQTATIEACYTTQSNLIAAAKSLDSRSILITSAVPGEGKSQCASNLATAMAYGGQKVLLIDADFLHPSQHEILKMSLEPGYAQVLQDGLDLPGSIRPTHISNLHLLSAGKNVLSKPEDLADLFSGPAHARNLKKLGRHYDMILIDGPPTMSMADAQLLSHMADSIVLVTAERTHQEEVYRARSMLRLAGGLLLGVIVNSVNLREMGDWNLTTPGEAPFSNYANSLRGRLH